jgi:hypothetical protein
LTWFFASFYYPVGARGLFERLIIVLACLFYLQRCLRHVRLLASHATSS